MNQPISYLGALQSAFKLAHNFNKKLGRRIQITKVAWAFYLDRESKTRKTVDIHLATNGTPPEDLAPIEFCAGDSAFSDQGLATPIPAFSQALENAWRNCLQVLESNRANPDAWALTTTEVMIAFVLDDQHELEFTESLQDPKNTVIHKITYTVAPH